MKQTTIFTEFLSLLKVKHTTEYSAKVFNEHPHKYNLFGLSSLLSDYDIENAATRITDKETDIYEIETPFVAHFGGDFVAVSKIEADKISFVQNGNKHTIPVSDFTNAWTGVVLLAEASEKSVEPDYKKHKKEKLFGFAQKILLSIAAGLILVFAYIDNSLYQSMGLNLLLFINLTGVFVCSMLILKQMNVQGKYVDKICSLFNQSDCNNVLESDAAKLWGIFGWSEIGLGYFVANALIILFFPQFVLYTILINILALPYTFWSIWYQKVKAKQWCPLCLVVMVLLWGIFTVSLLFGMIKIPALDWQVVAIFMLITCIYGTCMLSFNILTSNLSSGSQTTHLTQEINSLKANENVFKTLLEQQPKYDVSKNDSQIIFGNSEAPLHICILTNPFCNPCAAMHKRVEKFLHETNNNVCVQYVFSSFTPELDFACKYLIAARIEKGQSEFECIMADWFEKGKPMKEAFFADLQLDITNPAVEAEWQKHEQWIEKTQLRATPTIVVNGYKLPDNYRIEDLRYFTEI